MSKVLIVAEHHDGKLNAATAKCVSAGPRRRGPARTRSRGEWFPRDVGLDMEPFMFERTTDRLSGNDPL